MFGEHWIPVVVAMVTTFGAVLVAILQTRRVGKDVRDAKAHARTAAQGVTNSHEENLRDSLDRRFDTIDAKIDQSVTIANQAMEAVSGLAKDVRGMRADIGRAYDQRDRIEARVHDLEMLGVSSPSPQ